MVGDLSYISNDCNFETYDNVLLITGPIMSGKSTYMRQLALIVILAQIGSMSHVVVLIYQYLINIYKNRALDD